MPLTREKRLEGPGAEARLARLNARFRAISRRLPRTRRPDRTRLWLTLWLTAWATCVGAGLYLVLGRQYFMTSSAYEEQNPSGVSAEGVLTSQP